MKYFEAFIKQQNLRSTNFKNSHKILQNHTNSNVVVFRNRERKFNPLAIPLGSLATRFQPLAVHFCLLAARFLPLVIHFYHLDTHFQPLAINFYPLAARFLPLATHFYLLDSHFQPLAIHFYPLATHFQPLAGENPLAGRNPLARIIIERNKKRLSSQTAPFNLKPKIYSFTTLMVFN